MLLGLLAAAQSTSSLGSAAKALANKQYADAVVQLRAVRQPKIADYVAWMEAQADYELAQDPAVIEALKPVWSQSPKSPLTGNAAMLAAKSYMRANSPAYAAEILGRHARELVQPDGDLALAKAHEAAGDKANAAQAYQRIYYTYPSSPAAAEADAALERLKPEMGSAYPLVTPKTMLARALKLMESGGNGLARTELLAVAGLLAGAEQELARLRIGVAQYNSRQTAAALEYLRALQVATPDYEAERLHYMVQCGRRLKNDTIVAAGLEELARRFPKSKWRLDSIVSIANNFVVTNKPSDYEPLFRTCANDFAGVPGAAICHWRLAFSEYMRRGSRAAAMMQEHVRLYPDSDKVTACLYFLGRLAERGGDTAAARAWYSEINASYPNYYYAVLARARLTGAVGSAAPSAQVASFLRGVKFPQRSRRIDVAASALTKQRIERSRLLEEAGLDEYASIELRYAARAEDQPLAAAVALAGLEMRRSFPERAIRYIKRYAPGFLTAPIESAQAEFWRLAFPLPYRESLEKHSTAQSLDPYLVAALIRQESEFDARVVSHANAYGLTQVLPSTGRELARRLGIRGFSAKMLFEPDFNLNLGTRYLKALYSQLDNRWEPTLAAYNAGKTRAVAWLEWYDYQEPAEFDECIPFNETRNYVQLVIRNADIYRRLYGGNNPG